MMKSPEKYISYGSDTSLHRGCILPSNSCSFFLSAVTVLLLQTPHIDLAGKVCRVLTIVYLHSIGLSSPPQLTLLVLRILSTNSPDYPTHLRSFCS
jgi:hypothetical protein